MQTKDLFFHERVLGRRDAGDVKSHAHVGTDGDQSVRFQLTQRIAYRGPAHVDTLRQAFRSSGMTPADTLR